MCDRLVMPFEDPDLEAEDIEVQDDDEQNVEQARQAHSFRSQRIKTWNATVAIITHTGLGANFASWAEAVDPHTATAKTQPSQSLGWTTSSSPAAV